MKTVLAISLISVALLGTPAATLASETGAAAPESPAAPGGDLAPPPANSGQADAPETAGDQAVSDEDVMKNFTRHRPGACPEGPPCKVED